MQIKKIIVSNFKSFEEVEIEVGKFNVLIGANASGKSNFINILQFLKDIVENGLDNAISMQGGVDYIRNINIGVSKNLSVELHIDSKDKPVKSLGFGKEDDERLIRISAHEFTYKFSIQFNKSGRGYKVADERLVANCDFVEARLEKKERKISEKEKIGEGEIIFINDKGRVKSDLKSVDGSITKDDLILPSFSKKEFLEGKLSLKELFIGAPIFFPLLPPISFGISDFFRAISIYDLDPKLSKKATLITGKTELEPDGSNLAIVLKNILENKKKRERLSSLIKDILPFIEDITVEKLADKSLLASLKEVYSGKKFLPAPLLSDGTINITALIIALYFEEKPLIIIEEPERNIHPYIISKVIEMMKDVSERRKKQIIVTTHNPEVVRYTDIENIVLVHRDDNGFTQISRPAKKEEVKIFLENKMGIEELYVQNLLEW
ncbi:putative ATPase [Methanophagales archaeon]|nr:putative ATPase [Methanophagales archaeon]